VSPVPASLGCQRNTSNSVNRNYCLAPIADARVHEHTGGGYKGFCDYEEIKAAIKECDGLDGARLEACYAEFGCDVDRVTEHYARAAGIEKKQGKA
jgi:hypothetical protein